MEHSTPDYIAAWRSCIQGENKSWVLFEQGTCVILMQPETDLAAQAVALLREFGAVQVGTPSADFNVITLLNDSGWVVTGHHPDILNFVFADEGNDGNHVPIGLLGRSLRAMDAEYLRVVHIEDKRRR
ncbi:MAG: hypothetical protein D8B42_04610 [Kingella sp. (in: b-proteobacteria)]|nr:MAG: hypothetical protein D8B42_04610 [Kingella sp. (in: b-proteobacteria)]